MSFSARMRRVHAPPCFITARRAGICPETGKVINPGDRIAWFPSSKRAYHENSQAAGQVRGLEFAEAYNMPDANY
jgi:hypothetical protein